MKNTFNLLFISLILIINSCKTDKSNILLLPPLFSNHMVLQQKADVAVWGNANPESDIEITASWGITVETIADTAGNWITTIETPEAGGPFELSIKNKSNEIIINDVIIGEVWLCSGQSNMEMTMNGFSDTDTILGAINEIKHANYPYIRTFNVIKAISEKPEKNCNGKWIICSPESAGEFSATAYFFAKKLYTDIKVPVALIHSSWGGTPAESWISGKTLIKDDDFEEIVKKIEAERKVYNKYREWLNSHETLNLIDITDDSAFIDIDFQDSICGTANCNDNNWDTIYLPKLWEKTKIGTFDGAIWFRKKINIPESIQKYNLQLSLGPIDDMDIVYFNGTKIGGYEMDGFWSTPRIYNIPQEILKSGENQIAIRVIDTRGGGGIFGKKNDLKIIADNGYKLNIAGAWKYLIVAEYFNQEFYLFDVDSNDYNNKPQLNIELSAKNPTMLFNAMISPLIPYSIKGAIWYQGESNVGRANQYSRIFPALIQDWREAWNIGEFPFYFVQIAPWNYSGSPYGTESAYLREAQRKTLSLSNTGMAVTLDIGNFNNIHPANKKDVGERLALWALANNYEKDLICSGPLYLSHEIIDDKIIIEFDYVGAGLVFKDNKIEGFEICGRDKQYKKAEVIINNGNIIVFHPEIKNPVNVRYAFYNESKATLFNIEGLPASSFSTDEELP